MAVFFIMATHHLWNTRRKTPSCLSKRGLCTQHDHRDTLTQSPRGERRALRKHTRGEPSCQPQSHHLELHQLESPERGETEWPVARRVRHWAKCWGLWFVSYHQK